MPSRAVGIFACLLLAYVANYALGTWLDQQIPRWTGEITAIDGSTLNTSLYYELQPDTTLAATADREALLDFYAYLHRGGSKTYLNWRRAEDNVQSVSTDFVGRALILAGRTNATKYLSLLLLVCSLLLLYGGALKERHWFTPVLYLLIFSSTAFLYGALSAPLFTALVVGQLIVYFGSIRLALPIYHTEWMRMMRPGLTLCCFLLGTMAIRGPELIDYWFWTSELYRYFLVLVILLTLFFHLSIVTRVLSTAGMDLVARVFAFAMPLGITYLVTGLFLGLYGAPGEALVTLNYELVALPAAFVEGVDANRPFVLFFAGVMLLIAGAIGYFIRRISK